MCCWFTGPHTSPLRGRPERCSQLKPWPRPSSRFTDQLPLIQRALLSDWCTASHPDFPPWFNTVALWLRLTAPVLAGVRRSKYNTKVQFLWREKPTDTLSLSCARLLQPLIFSALSWQQVFCAAVVGGGSLLNKAEAVDHFVQVEVCVLPRLHGGLFSLQSRKKDKHGDSAAQ